MVTKKVESRTERLHRDSYILLSVLSSEFSRDIERICKSFDLTEAHFRVLWAVCNSGSTNGIAMGEIADGLVNRAADLTRLVDKMVKMKLVERVQSPEDRRRMMVHITTKGRTAFNKIAAEVKSEHYDQWSALNESELRQLSQLLKKALEPRAALEDKKSWQV